MIGPSPKLEYPPLLEPGMHKLSLLEVRKMCVEGFPTSASREDIITLLEHMFETLRLNHVICEVWVDGSFMTRKINPGDVDLVVCLSADFADNCYGEQQAVLDDISANLKRSGKCTRCDTFACVVPQASDPLFKELSERVEYWKRWFGHSRSGEPKGMATVQMGEIT